ncbi:MAG: diguanylate cyclase [Nitrosomonadales bacterium]|nr:diguanylate cyclase [Nitrosomonadales bacterium]
MKHKYKTIAAFYGSAFNLSELSLPSCRQRPELGLSALLLLFALLFTPCDANPAPLQLSAQDTQVEIVPYLQLHEDPDGTQQFGDIARQRDWLSPAGMQGAINIGYSRSVWWLRLDIESDTPLSRYLEIGYPSLDSVEVFVPHAGGEHLHLQAGDLQPFSQRLLPHRNLVFPVEFPAGKSSLYMRISSAGSLTIPASIWEPRTFHLHNQTSYAALAIYFGMLIALGSYNLLLYFSLRDRTYLYYVLFLASMAIGTASLDGLAGQFIWPDWPTWTHLALPIGMAMSGLLAACFVRSFLDSRQNSPRTDVILKSFIAWFAVSILLNLASYQWAEIMTSLGGMGFSTIALTIGVISYRRGYPGARYFLLAWTSMLTGSILLAARNFGWVPTNFITIHGLQIGSALEMLLLSYALADRINALRRAKELADARLLQMQQENVAALLRSEQELEKRVAERTQELAEANARLEGLSRQDPLTGLGNRNELEEAWEKMEGHARRHDRNIVILLMDLNNFKPINDTHGHHVGDHVLIEVAARLHKNMRVTDTVVRLGGDEFVILANDIATNEGIGALEDKIREVISEPIRIDDSVLQVGVSIGFARYPSDGTTLSDLMQHADSAMYQDKRQCIPR